MIHGVPVCCGVVRAGDGQFSQRHAWRLFVDVDRCAAPGLRVYIRERFREVPSVSVKVLCAVLTLAVEVIRRFRQDPGAGRSRAFAVSRRIFDSYLHNDGAIRRKVPLGDCEAPLTGEHLDTMIANTQAHTEAEGLLKPFRCDTWVGVAKNRNQRAGRN